MGYKVSVIVPIFKVEQFIGHCAIQLFEQTLSSVEFIFVDDCTPDNSIQVLEEVIQQYPIKKNDVKIHRHSVNKGLPSARNSGLALATGDYIFHCDSDDWLSTDALDKMYKKACKDQADIVWCDWYLSFANNERYMSQAAPKAGPFTGKESVKLLLGGRIKYNVWNKLVKRTIYIEHDIQFPDGYGMGEDMTMIKLFAFAKTVSYLPEALYHYVQLNNEAFTKKTTPQHLDQIKYNVDNLTKFLEKHYGHTLDEYIHYFKLNTKLPFLISSDNESFERWNSWYMESNAYIDKNPLFNMRTRFIQKAALHKQYWILKLYYTFVIRLVYGFIYK